MVRAFILSTLMAATAGGAAALANNGDALVSSAAWWEKLVVTVGAGGDTVCRYQSSLTPGSVKSCEVEDGALGAEAANDGAATAITFERRFTPGTMPDAGNVAAGDTILGRAVIALSIGANGKVEGCKVVATDGDAAPSYGCKEARAERFQTAVPAHDEGTTKAATMTILVYAHEEHFA